MKPLKFILRFKGGPGSGDFGHSGRPGQVGGSSSGGSDLRTVFWTSDDRNKTVGKKLSNGFEVMININGPKDGSEGDYKIYYRGIEQRTLSLDNDGNLVSVLDGKPFHGTAKEAISYAANVAKSKESELLDRGQKIANRYKNADTDPVYQATATYRQHATPENFESMIDAVKYDLGAYIHAKEQVKKDLKFDRDGYITLYRGGSDTGASWSIDKDEAEKFARYGFGSVHSSVSGFMGIEAIRAGAEQKDVTVYSKKFHISDILISMVKFGEGEVIIDPDKL